MMYKLTRLRKEHLVKILASPINSDMRQFFTDQVIDNAVLTPFSVALLVKGDVMAVGGVNHQWADRAIIWAFFSDKSKGCFLPVFRGVKKWLEWLPYKRLEMDIPYGNEKVLKRAKLWGFEVECERARKFGVLGNDCVLLSKVRS
jgi:hypothetical protein